jgi:phycocyanobilin lyase alpha subunit
VNSAFSESATGLKIFLRSGYEMKDPSTELLHPPLTEAQVIENLRQTEDFSDQYYAAWWLGRMRSRHPETLPLLLAALDPLYENPIHNERRAVALNAIRALGILQATNAEENLRSLLKRNDYSIREESARSLGMIQAQAAIPDLCELLSGGQDEAEQIQPGSAKLKEPYESVLEALGAIGVASHSVIIMITPFTNHSRPLIRASACRALLLLTGDQKWATPLIELLQHDDPLIRRGVLLDLGATGWMPALPAIQAAAIENSLKLVALRGLAEKSEDTSALDAMDALL